MACDKCINRKLGISLLIIGGLFFLVSLVVLACFPTIYEQKLKASITLTEDSMSYGFWKVIPLPIYERLYFFNITNAEDFMKNGTKMKVNQVGPYVYEGKWVKENIGWHPNGTVSYQERRTYHFREDLSSGKQEDMVYTINAPLATLGALLKSYNIVIKALVSTYLIIHGDRIIIERSIGQLVYDGYEDSLIKYGKIIVPDTPYKDGKFAWLYGKNDTYDGRFTVFSGQGDVDEVNVIDRWNGEKKLPFWKGDGCNMMNGSSGEMGPPIDEGQQEYSFFQSMICRTLTFKYSGEVTHKGLKSKSFVVTDKTMTNYPDCFNTDPSLFYGVQDISTCQYGAPMVLSFPNFYLGDPRYAAAIDGLDRNSNFTSHIDVEPRTGISTEISIKFQINVNIHHVGGLFPFYQTPPGLYPVFWIEIYVSLTDDLGRFFYNQLEGPKILVYSVIGVVLGLSLVLMILGIFILITYKRKLENRDDPLMCPYDETRSDPITEKPEKFSNVEKSQKNVPSSTSTTQPILNTQQCDDKNLVCGSEVDRDHEDNDDALLVTDSQWSSKK